MMTLYYTLVFALLMAEMAIFMLLIIPFPFKVRRKIFTFISESRLVAKLQYGLKITFIFILILFIDSVNRVYRVQIELMSNSESRGSNGAAAIVGHERTEVQARKFYSQRNMYLCGFTLFLSLILNRTYTMILEILKLEERVKAFESRNSSALTKEVQQASEPAEIGGLRNEVDDLQKELKKKDKDLKAMRSQADGLSREYDELAEKYNNAVGDDGVDKKDI
ncbi:B-cell receptor-associated 31-like protein [Zalerion maritima]|uniref:Endoplasmic reticulum transmembrane protein n=1 Tax=Zalerion maritima TaxID=339359 RepID=A0AAD5WWU9_9PEZI|nr:B-cell receptor-associated 31-like protein [Zalerion maritima]